MLYFEILKMPINLEKKLIYKLENGFSKDGF
jgi:hypothetical protein